MTHHWFLRNGLIAWEQSDGQIGYWTRKEFASLGGRDWDEVYAPFKTGTGEVPVWVKPKKKPAKKRFTHKAGVRSIPRTPGDPTPWESYQKYGYAHGGFLPPQKKWD